LVSRNHSLLRAGDDLGLAVFVTPGAYPTLRPHDPPQPTVGMHTYSLPFSLWANKYKNGQHLVTSRVQQISPRSWPAELKCRSRMHYYLADREAQAVDRTARALLLDENGCVTEASTANVVAYLDGTGLVSPPQEKILPGISIAVLSELAAACGIPFVYRDLQPSDLSAADEVLLTSTSSCLIPVVRLDQRPIGTGKPGPVFARLMAMWSKLVGIDIVDQATKFAQRA
jgi:branched-subunit amino acid aminotransferase/4-amino-4-deoxychorismate lyase